MARRKEAKSDINTARVDSVVLFDKSSRRHVVETGCLLASAARGDRGLTRGHCSGEEALQRSFLISTWFRCHHPSPLRASRQQQKVPWLGTMKIAG
jgi:hypothetical protein